MGKLIGERFQQETKYDRWRMPEHSIDWGKKPLAHKEYLDARRIALDRPKLTGDMGLFESILRRKSLRRVVDVALSMAAISCSLWASSGIQRKEMGFEFRTAPSAGALYPIETYAIVHRVEGIEPGSTTTMSGPCPRRDQEGRLPAQHRPGGARTDHVCPGLGRHRVDGPLRAFRMEIQAARLPLCVPGRRAYGPEPCPRGHQPRTGSCQVGALFDDEVNDLLASTAPARASST